MFSVINGHGYLAVVSDKVVFYTSYKKGHKECIITLLNFYISLLNYLSIVLLSYRNFMFSPDVPIRLDYHGKKWVDREHVSSEISRVLVRYFEFYKNILS